MVALIIASADKCTVIIVDNMAACFFIGQSFLGVARVFCAPYGVTT
jgi:hypothetical protein